MFIWDFVASTVMDNLIDWFYGQIVGFLGNFFSAMGNMGVEIFELEWVQAIVLFFSQLGWALYGVSLVVCAFEFGIEYTTGRANLQHTALGAIKGFLAVSLFTILPVRLYALSVSLQGQLSAGLTGYGTSIGDVGQQIITDLGSVESIADMTQVTLDFGFGVITSPIMLLFCIILIAYAGIKVFFANLKRGGILLIQIAVGSLYMFSIPRGYVDGFVQWMKQVIGLCLTAFLQSTILVAGLMVQGPRPAGTGAHALRGGGAQDRRYLWPGYHNESQHHERGLHSAGRRQHHPDHRGRGGAEIGDEYDRRKRIPSA